MIGVDGGGRVGRDGFGNGYSMQTLTMRGAMEDAISNPAITFPLSRPKVSDTRYQQ